jgi:Na+/phosphate symporter
MNELLNPAVLVSAKLFLSLVLLTAALPKLRQADEFLGVVANYRILPRVLVAPFAALLPWLELACAAALLVPASSTLAAWATTALCASFALALGINIARGRTHIDCGCRRRPTSRSRIGGFHVVRALGLAGLAALVAAAGPASGQASFGALALGVVAALMLALIHLVADLMNGLPDASAGRN